MPHKNVVVAVTDVDALKKAIPSMVEWMGRLSGNGRVTLLYVEDVYNLDAATPVLEDMKIKEIQLREVAELFEEHGVEAEWRVKAGRFSEEVVKEAKRLKSFAILISTDGRAGLSKMFSGSTIEEIIRSAPCPVVVFKPKLLRFTDRIALTLSSRIKRLSAAAALDQS